MQLNSDVNTKKSSVKLSPTLLRIAKQVGIFILFFGGSRAMLPESLAPFAQAAAVSAYICELPFYIIAACALGAASRLAWDSAFIIGVFYIAAWAFRQLSRKIYKRQVKLSFIIAQILGVIIFRTRSTNMDLLMGILGAVAAQLLVQVYSSAIVVMQSLRTRKLLSEEEIIAICIAVGTVLLGISDINIFFVNPSVILAGSITFLLASTGGSGAGASSGLALGIMLAAGGKGEYVGILGLTGVVAGGLRRLGKIGVAAGGISATAVMIFYSKGEIYTVLNIAIAAGVFLLFPQALFDEVGRFVNASVQREHNRREYLYRLREMTGDRLKEFSGVFEEMGSIFAQPLKKKIRRKWEIETLESFCEGCAAQNRCWSDVDKLQSEFEDILKTNRVPFRLQRCKNLQQILHVAAALYRASERESNLQDNAELYTTMAGRQLKGVATVTESLSKRLEKDVRYDDILEAKILKGLDKVGIHAKDVVAQFAGGRLNIMVEGRNCANQCTGKMLEAVSKACGKSMRLTSQECDGQCKATFEQSRAFEVIAAIVQRGKGDDDIIGDTAISIGLPDGRHLFALSDGMGTGERAAQESKAAISLLKRLYSAGVERNVMIEAVNRLLLLSSSDEMFSTVDACCIDLVNGYSEFCKLGAAPTFWLSSQGVQALDCETLPLGILERAEPKVFSMSLNVGDWIVMMSDGVADALGDHAIEAVSTYACSDPKSAALCLIELAQSMGANDDMTVIAAKIEGGMLF